MLAKKFYHKPDDQYTSHSLLFSESSERFIPTLYLTLNEILWTPQQQLFHTSAFPPGGRDLSGGLEPFWRGRNWR